MKKHKTGHLKQHYVKNRRSKPVGLILFTAGSSVLLVGALLYFFSSHGREKAWTSIIGKKVKDLAAAELSRDTGISGEMATEAMNVLVV